MQKGRLLAAILAGSVLGATTDGETYCAMPPFEGTGVWKPAS